MDYDDNDFESQNLHLAGEGSTKFPPVLRPYALPKFDFDESLQANLRFDSLVETEVFLGIESNEDNQWIDAFSRGGSGIEFSSTAAGSCSISRHGNIWSEATSSESVEMLLKSVGQGEYIPRQTAIQESDVCDELACLAKQMDSNPKPDDKIEFKYNVTDLQPPGSTHTSFSGLKEDVGMEQSQVGVSQGHEGELSIDGSSGILEPNDMSEGSPTLFTNDKSNNTNQREVETLADDLHPGKTQDSLSAFVVETNSTESSMQNMVDEQQGPQQTQNNNQDLESSMMNKEAVIGMQTLGGNAVGGDAHHPDKSLFSIPSQETLEGGSIVEGPETGLSSLEDSLKMGSVVVSDLQKEERCSEDICSRDLSRANANENLVLLKDVVMDDQSAPNTCASPKVSIKDDSVSEGQVVEVSNSSCGICPNLQQNVDVMEKKTISRSNVTKENELLSTGDHTDAGTLSTKTEASVFPAEENSISVVSEGNSDNMVGGISSFGLVASSTNSSILGESTQICVNNEHERQSDHEKFDQYVTKENELLNTGDHTYTGILSSKSDASMCLAEENITSVVREGNSDSRIGGFSSLSLVASSTNSSILGESSQICVSNEPERRSDHEKFDQDVTKENELLSSTSDHTDTGILSSKSEASVFPAEENSISVVCEGNSDDKVGGFSGFRLVASSTNSSILGESTQICVNNEPERQSDHEKSNQDVSVNDQENKKICPDSSQMHYDVAQSHLGDKGVVPSSLAAGSMESELTTSTVSIDVRPVNNSASQFISENISLTSCEIMENPPPGEVVSSSTHGTTGDNDFQRVTPVESSSAEGKEESAVNIAEEAGISILIGSSEQGTAPCPVKGTEKLHPSDISGQLLCDIASNSMHDVGTCGAVKIGEPQRTINDKVAQECTEEIGVPPVICESSEKQGDGVTVSVIKDDKETLQEIQDKSSSKELGDVLLGNKGSVSSAPLPDSCVELPETGSFPANSTCSPSNTFRSPSQTEMDENQAKASANRNPPASDSKNSGTNSTVSTAQVLKGNDASKDERSSTREVNPVVDLSKKDIADVNTEEVGKTQSVPVTETKNASTALEGYPSTSGLGPSKTKTVGNVSHGNPQISDRAVGCSASKATPERKTRRSSNKAAGKESARRGSKVKDTTPAKQSERGDKSTKVSLGPSPGFKLMQSNEVQQYGHIDSNSTKSFALVNTSTSSLPDLNTSASPPVLFHQPFTDLQQVQLRAQIFVYGALIQGTVPDEAYMISAFGGTDGGRSIWENAWRACLERQHSQKSHPNNPETPLQSRSVARTSESAVKQGKGISSPLGRASSKATPTIANPLIPLSSPLWSLPTLSCDSLQSSALARGSVVDYSQALTPLHPYQSPPPRNFLGHNASWISQAPLRGPWIGSPIPASDNSTHLSASPASDTVKLGSVKGSSLPPSSGIKNVTPGPPPSNVGLQSIFVGTAQLDANNVTIPPAQRSSDPKPKRKKKVVVSEDLGQNALQSLTPPAVGSRTSTSVVVTPVGNVPISTVDKPVMSVFPLADQTKNDLSVEKRILSDESLMKVKEARVHAEEASALSAAAVNHSLELWKQLDKHKNSGLMSDIEAKLASAAVAVAAAAAVAKAAAAAANVASNAAFQAKLMADEALISSGYENSSQSSKISLSEGTSNLGQATPVSILKGANGTNSPGSIIFAAKEAVRKRVEAASAATKRAENMDAIVKAAELAAEAVSQAGRIVTMGDPLPLIDLVEAGPEGSWKAARESPQEVGLLKNMTRDLVNIDVSDIPETSHIHNRDISSGGISASIEINEKNSRAQKACKVSDLVKPVDMVPGSEPEIQAPFTVRNGSENLEENNFKEGSLIEVFKDEEGYKAGWFVANILSLKDGKAYVCYTSLVAAEGPLKEWVSLEREGDKPPRIRTARPLTSLQHEGTRKRRRAAMGDYAWSVGDRVDAWIQESWREAVITEKNKKDETALTVHFPGIGETSVVRAWHLRPSFIWKDGKWIEFSKVGANDSSTRKGDTPHEKRPKLGSNAVEVKRKDQMPKSLDAVESANPDEMKLLNLTEHEKVFNIGKSSKNENKQDSQRLVRTGLQKEGSRVIFGVPKPGKKRKFMEVSKHYDAHGSSKTDDRNDSVKIANFLMPQSSGSRGWRNSSKNDTKEKPGADSKPKTKFGKPQGVLGRVNPSKNVSASSAFSLTTDLTGHAEMTKDSSKHFKNASQSASQAESAPYAAATDASTEGPILFSSLATSTDAPPTRRTFTSRASKGKLAPAGDKLGKGDGEKASTKSTSDVAEPRRSNRRIQPTSRLLEGLQSSLIVSKIPSFSHNRNTSKGNNHG